MREYDVKVCGEECGRTVWRSSYWLVKDDAGSGGDCYGSSFHCPKCGTRVGIDERGPWREAMVPRAALEWAVRQIDGCVYRDGRECAVVESGEENEDCFDGICFEHRMQAALKAAEEASDAATTQSG